MNRRPRSFGASSLLILALSAASLLPIAPNAQHAVAADPPEEKLPYPVIVSTSPKVGEIDVDPKLKEITVTFDRDMGKGMSWTGGGPMFPADNSRKASWKDNRTCVLPVLVKEGEAYRVGINSKSFQNFKSKDGIATPPSAIFFATKGASDAVKRSIIVPKIVSLKPTNGATDVDASIKELSVTFDTPMGEGMSWTGGGDSFPTILEGQRGKWSADKLTCTLPVDLQPGHAYVLGINSLKYVNFQSEAGVPAQPVVYKFTTKK